MKEEHLSLENPFYAYLFGLIQTDGHLYQNSRNRGRLSIEVSKRDEDLFIQLQNSLPFNSSIRQRVRNTNFSNEYVSIVWNVFDKKFRDFLIQNGLPSGKKSEFISPPVCKYLEIDYVRGLIDGDGSLGLTASGFPFLSFVTASSKIANEYLSFLESITKKEKTANTNTRDNVYNIAIYKEDAQLVAKTLYYTNCLAMPRKIAKVKEILDWQRPSTMKRVVNRKRWKIDEDNFILSNSIKESIIVLDRSQHSIEMRLWRLHSNKQPVTD